MPLSTETPNERQSRGVESVRPALRKAGADIGLATLTEVVATMQDRSEDRIPLKPDERALRSGTLGDVTDPVNPEDWPTSEDRRRAIQEHAWLTRDGRSSTTATAFSAGSWTEALYRRCTGRRARADPERQ